MSFESFDKKTDRSKAEGKISDFDQRVSNRDVGNSATEKAFSPDDRIERNNLTDNSKSTFDPDKRIKSDNKEIPGKLGGSYKEVKNGIKEEDFGKYEVHHMPADSVTDLPLTDGPAIKMDKADHKQTASYGASKEAKAYRAKQKELIDSGDFKGAVQMDIDDIKDKFGNKYDKAINEMQTYVKQLEGTGQI